jgi:hypothetical protein
LGGLTDYFFRGPYTTVACRAVPSTTVSETRLPPRFLFKQTPCKNKNTISLPHSFFIPLNSFSFVAIYSQHQYFLVFRYQWLFPLSQFLQADPSEPQPRPRNPPHDAHNPQSPPPSQHQFEFNPQNPLRLSSTRSAASSGSNCGSRYCCQLLWWSRIVLHNIILRHTPDVLHKHRHLRDQSPLCSHFNFAALERQLELYVQWRQISDLLQLRRNDLAPLPAMMNSRCGFKLLV